MTIKQKIVAKDLLENTGKPVSKAMLDAGYAPATAKNPKELTESKGWQDLMDEYLPDEKVLKAHSEALEAKKVVTSHTEPDYEVADHQTRLKAADLAYKVKRKITDGPNVQINNFIPILGETKINVPEDNSTE